MKVTDLETRLKLQGDKVLVIENGQSDRDGIILTIIHVVDTERRYLELAQREKKNRGTWPLDQETVNQLTPLKGHKDAKWRLVL